MQLDLDKDQQVTAEELEGIRALTPVPPISRAQFTQRFRRGEHADAPTEVVMKAFKYLDKNKDGELAGKEETQANVRQVITAIYKGYNVSSDRDKKRKGRGQAEGGGHGASPGGRRGGPTMEGRNGPPGRGQGAPRNVVGQPGAGGKRVAGGLGDGKRQQPPSGGRGVAAGHKGERRGEQKAHLPGKAHPRDLHPERYSREL
jgi:hypothetical protein